MSARGVTLEDVIETAVSRAVAGAVGELKVEIAALRRALPPQLGSVQEAARACGCSTRTIWRLIRDGKLPHRKLGRKTVVDLTALHPVSDDDVTE
jgi:excisionase family DNA binding protein